MAEETKNDNRPAEESRTESNSRYKDDLYQIWGNGGGWKDV